MLNIGGKSVNNLLASWHGRFYVVLKELELFWRGCSWHVGHEFYFIQWLIEVIRRSLGGGHVNFMKISRRIINFSKTVLEFKRGEVSYSIGVINPNFSPRSTETPWGSGVRILRITTAVAISRLPNQILECPSGAQELLRRQSFVQGASNLRAILWIALY